MPDFTLRQMGYFKAVAEAGSISAAANLLHVSPTALSAAITELERILGSQLLIRRKAHGVSLTPTGSFVYNRAAELLDLADEMQLSAASGGARLKGPLVIGCYFSLAPRILPALLEGFGAIHPDVDVVFVESSQDEIQRRLMAGELDVAIVYDVDLGAGLISAELYDTSGQVLLPAAHRLADRETVTLAELADDPLVLLDSTPSSQYTLSLFRDASVDPTIRYRVADYELARSLVGRNMGYSIIVQVPAARVSVEGRTFLVKPITPAVRPVSVKVVWPRGVRLSDRAKAMIDFAVSVYRPDDIGGRVAR
ncbi:LysR family transcriptional regulator [Rhodococcus wratislaviensis]|uniref:Putative LysR family transcriptional regulator n=1 Tax=Rhodococcus wratislaviensis NBRC 100605 TaxID=1219028 RepID=X0PLB1_RHOWR|nr:LysR family transcriptional regulator [Rhodococcus wratislaviensis]GAF43148.1 putative LysR family transcriptional regulator [Rhodococcus wratislaviensis NBRC 100605]